MSTLYENIMALCERRGITGYRLCKDLGISPSVITDLKNGRKKTVSADYANRIANYFGVSVDRIINGDDSYEFDEESNGLEAALEALRSLPGHRALLAATKGMTQEQAMKMASFLETVRGGDND